MAGVPVGVSTCLLGENVRHDGGHKYHPFLCEILGECFRWIPVCPEVEIGLGAPREPIRLVSGADLPLRLVTVESRVDITARMTAFAESRCRELRDSGLRGYVFKSRSPSCGPRDIPVHDARGRVARREKGLFARSFVERYPDLPVTSETALESPLPRAHFVERVLGLDRLDRFLARPASGEELGVFHAEFEGVLSGHDPRRSAELRRIASRSAGAGEAGPLTEYRTGFLDILRVEPSLGHLAAVLPALLDGNRDLARRVLGGE